MQFTSFILPALLVAAPALVLARGCQQFQTTYYLPCKGNCPASKSPFQNPRI
ncbi:hypothetical protein Vi05172_g6684 [Venturia inaequalis]|nr:hypothetical protein Vi05172_g6684 [Venturia inaequalis]